MTKYTITALSSMIERKLSHNFGVTPDQASDELFYKACVLVLLEIMSDRRAEFKKAADAEEAKTVYYLSMEFLMGVHLKIRFLTLTLPILCVKRCQNSRLSLISFMTLNRTQGSATGDSAVWQPVF